MTVHSVDEAKPCPFCGAWSTYMADMGDSLYSVHCQSCGTLGPVIACPDKRIGMAKAIEHWNKRVGVLAC